MSATVEAGDLPRRNLFEIADVGVTIDGRTILAPTTLTIEAGQVLGLIGHNGSGKSTLLRLLARHGQPSQGKIAFLGQPVENWESRAYARHVAYLPQQLSAAGGLNAEELVALGRYPWHGAFGRFTDEDRAKVERAMALTDTGVFAGRRVDNLSGGERQRVWLAMLIAQDAKVLLLDEPTSALDLKHQVEILKLVHDLAREQQLTVVIVLHEINMAARFCDRLVALKGGRVIEDADPDSLMNEATLLKVLDLPMGVMAHPGNGRPIAYVR